MNEAAYNLYAISGEARHRRLAEYFYKAAFMDPLARKVRYSLTGQHANTHLPEIIGVARGWELTGNATLADITTFFYEELSQCALPARPNKRPTPHAPRPTPSRLRSHAHTLFVSKRCLEPAWRGRGARPGSGSGSSSGGGSTAVAVAVAVAVGQHP